MEQGSNGIQFNKVEYIEDDSPLSLVSTDSNTSSSFNTTFTIDSIEEDVLDPVAALSDSLSSYTPKRRSG